MSWLDWNVLDEYLVQIGADIDRNSFNSAKSALDELKRHLSGLKHAAAPLALAAAIGAVGKAAYETVKGVAQADMEYQKLAASMWVTKETAKSLSVALKTMGVSQEDLAWVPELREQFFRLRAEMREFSTPEDADAQLRYIREIGYDVQALFVRLKMLKEWIAYYLIKYLEPYIKDFKAFINWLLDKLGEDLPGLARKVALAMSTVLSPVLSTLKLIGMAIGKIYDFIVELPENVKKWAVIFAAVGTAIMAGPFGLIIAGLTMAMVLLEDFLGYMNGWDSSADLAPLWEALLAFKDGAGSEWLDEFKVKLGEIADTLDYIVGELDIPGVLEKIKEAVVELKNGLVALWQANKKEFSDLLKQFGFGVPQAKLFFGTIATGISEAIKTFAAFAKLIGKVLQAVALAKEGKFLEAGGLFKDSIVEFGGSVVESNKTFFGKAWDNLKTYAAEKFGIGGGGDGSGGAVVDNASSFERGYKWMDPTGANTDPRNQCASFASQMMAGAGVPVDVTMNGNDLASQFKAEGAYHRPGDGYVPQPGDLIDWAHHVGIYAGNGEYIARNSSGGVIRGSMQGMEQHFGELWGFGSVSELTGARNQDETAGTSAGALAIADRMGEATEDYMQDIGQTTVDSYGAEAAGFMEGSNQMASVPGLSDIFSGIGGAGSSSTFNLGNPVININVAGTNASAQEIAGAVKDGLTDLGDYMLNIQARQMRRATI